MTNRELLEKAIYWFRVIAEDMERITSGNLPHNAATTKGRAIRAYEFLERHKNDEDDSSCKTAINGNDNEIVKRLIEYFENLEERFSLLKSRGADCVSDEDLNFFNETIVWLKSLKPQLKQELSEEDERWFEEMELMCLNFSNDTDYREKFSTWLKSIKDRYTFKPSNEQMKVCKEVYADILSAKGFDLGTVNSELNRLEEELKKLKD